MNAIFFTTSILLGIGLAMDACAVSMANGLKEPKMKLGKNLFISTMFGLFQAGMPLIGYFCGHALIDYIGKFIPWIALILLGFIGIKMLIDGIKEMKNKDEDETLTIHKILIKTIFVQAVATSIDALSVGFTIADYSIIEAIVCTSIIALITFLICVVAIFIGKKFGTLLNNKAEILGGIILIGIGISIFIQGLL